MREKNTKDIEASIENWKNDAFKIVVLEDS